MKTSSNGNIFCVTWPLWGKFTGHRWIPPPLSHPLSTQPKATGALFQYQIRRLTIRSRKISKPSHLYLELFDRFEIWQAPRQHCCRCACQITKRYDTSNYQSRWLETSRDLIIRRLIGYWNGALGFNIIMLSYQYRKSHCGDKAVVRSSYLLNGISYTCKTASLYWIRVLVTYISIFDWHAFSEYSEIYWGSNIFRFECN